MRGGIRRIGANENQRCQSRSKILCGPEEKTFSNKKEVPMSPEKIPTRTRLALAQKLRFLRFTRGWSQEVLAELVGLHRTYISQIERGQVNVSVDNLEKLADAFELPVPELLTPPSPADLAEHFKDLGVKEPRAYYGPVAVGLIH